MSAKVAFLARAPEAAERKPVVAVRADAVAKRGDKSVVYVLDGKNVAKEVGVGNPTKVGDLMQVANVKAGDKVAINPPEKLRDGATVCDRQEMMPAVAPAPAGAQAPLVSITHLSKSYRRGEQIVPVLHDITLAIPRGDFIALMGPSGSGKSTLLNLIAGIDKPDSGELLVGGEDITRLSEGELADWRAANVGFIFQFYNLMPVLNAFENVELPLLLTALGKRDRRERVEMALALVGLADRMDHHPNELSGGQQQRVAIARALITDPTLIVADEPTGDLDRKSAEDVLALLRRLNATWGRRSSWCRTTRTRCRAQGM
jgi:putative ABC transport system ATP-binding protein